MVSLAAGAAGAAMFEGAAGVMAGMIGTAIGTAVDQLWLMPRLFGEDNEIPSVGSFEVNYADEGTPGVYCYGSHNRFGAQIILAGSPFKKFEQKGGGKRGETTQVTQYVDVVYGCTFNPLAAIESVDLDAHPAFRASPDRSEARTLNACQAFITFNDGSVQVWEFDGTFWQLRAWEVFWENLKFGGTAGGPIAIPGYAEFTPGATCSVSWTNPGNSTVTVSNLIIVASEITGISQINGVENTRVTVDLMPWVEALPAAQGPATPQSQANGWFGGVQFWQTKHYRNQSGVVALGNNMHPWQPYPGPPLSTWNIQQVGAPTTDPNLLTTVTTTPAGGINNTYLRRRALARTPGLPGMGVVGADQVNIGARGGHVPNASVFANEAYTRDASGTPQGAERTMSYMLQRMLYDHSEFEASHLDTTGLVTDEEVLGLQHRGTSESARVLADLILYGDLHVAEHGQALHFMERGQRAVIDVPHEAFDGRGLGDLPRRKIRWSRSQEIEKPSRLHLKFINADNDLQDGDVLARRDNVTSGATTGTTRASAIRQSRSEIPMRRSKARQMAYRMLRDTQEVGRQASVRMAFWSPRGDTRRHEPQPLQYTETDILKSTAANSRGGSQYASDDHYLSVRRVDIGADLMCEFEVDAMADDPTSVPVTPLDATTIEENPSEASPEAGFGEAPWSAEILDIPALLDKHARTPGVYVAYMGRGSSTRAPNAAIAQGTGSGDAYEVLEHASTVQAIGYVRHDGKKGVVGITDYTIAIEVEILSGDWPFAFESVTEADLDNGANMAVWSTPEGPWEVLQYLTATMISDPDNPGASSGRTWKLEGLRRGLRATEELIKKHRAGDRLIPIDRSRVHFLELDRTAVGQRRSFRALPPHRAFNLDPATSHTILANSSLPAPPANFRAERKENGDVVFDWDRRARVTHRVLGTAPLPLLEGVERYELVISGRSDALVCETPPVTYTAAEQATDSNTDLLLNCSLHQIDQERGRGRAATLVVAETLGSWEDEGSSTDTFTDEGGNVLLI